MITLKLLGSIKKYCGKESIAVHEKETTLSNIFSILYKNMPNPRRFDTENLLILINGVDLSISGDGQKIKSGDIVTIANLVHGG
ncbi:MAG TPA: MoaD/ThiS family protein [Nitrososphaeraceae archaeon]|nr:MoaD/ThiS family protein [Nitrososphaeraceae archaeon]